jgi:hypothetical protein
MKTARRVAVYLHVFLSLAVSGQLYAPATLSLGKKLQVPIAGKVDRRAVLVTVGKRKICFPFRYPDPAVVQLVAYSVLRAVPTSVYFVRILLAVHRPSLHYLLIIFCCRPICPPPQYTHTNACVYIYIRG